MTSWQSGDTWGLPTRSVSQRWTLSRALKEVQGGADASEASPAWPSGLGPGSTSLKRVSAWS